MSLLNELRTGLSSDPTLDRPAGVEIRQELQPAGGLPVAPPSYEGRLEIHQRHVDGELRDTVELDSIGSSANRIEEVLLDLYGTGGYPLPVMRTKVTAGDREIPITTLEAPHRVFDAWIRLSAAEDGSGRFEDGPLGQELARADLRALDAILETSAHDLLFGSWDSHRKGPNGQLRISRALTSTVIGFDPVEQARFAARRDPLNLGEASDAGKAGKRLSEQGLSSLPPQRSIPYEEGQDGNPKSFGGKVTDHRGGVSISGARFQGFLSFAALRRLGFARYDDVDVRVMLAALALYATALRSAGGWDLRARCALLADGPTEFALVAADGTRRPLDASLADLRALFEDAVKAVDVTDRSVELDAGDDLNALVATSVAATKSA